MLGRRKSEFYEYEYKIDGKALAFFKLIFECNYVLSKFATRLGRGLHTI